MDAMVACVRRLTPVTVTGDCGRAIMVSLSTDV
jgi:hypothetical protein